METQKKYQSKNREARVQMCHQMVKRLEEYAHFKGETLTELQRALGLSAAYFSAPKRGRGIFGADSIALVLNHYRDLSPDWLLFGNGSKLRGGTPEEVKVAETAYKKNKVEKEYDEVLEKVNKLRTSLRKVVDTMFHELPK